MILDHIKTILKGFVGSMIFGVYHMYHTTNIINKNNTNTRLRLDENYRNIQLRLDENHRNTQLRINELFKMTKK